MDSTERTIRIIVSVVAGILHRYLLLPINTILLSTATSCDMHRFMGLSKGQ
jgi:hypothetical protein